MLRFSGAALLGLMVAAATACGGTPGESTADGGSALSCTDGPIEGAPETSCTRSWSCSDGAVTYKVECKLGSEADAGSNWECSCYAGDVEQKWGVTNPFGCATDDAKVVAREFCGWKIP